LKILFVHSGSDLYGSSRSLLRLSSRLLNDGHTVEVILPSLGMLCGELSKVGVSYHVLKSLSVINRFRFASPGGMLRLLIGFPVSVIQILQRIHQLRPDIIHTNTSVVLSSALAAKLTGIPHIWHVRESFAEFPGLFRWYQWYMFLFSTKICCVSTPMAEQFHPAIRNRRAVVIHNGFPLSEFEGVNPGSVAEFRSQYGLEDKVAIGLVGRIRLGRKGQEVFVKAANRLRKEFPNARFLIIGSPFPGNEMHLTRLQELIKSLGVSDCVKITGDATNIKAAMSALDVSVLASGMPEPFGGVVVESMALGKPVVGTAIGGTLEQIEDGVTGFLIPPEDDVAMANAIRKLLVDPSLIRTMGEKAAGRFRSRFEFEKFYQQVSRLYSDVLALK
jgi:glycosyltransferase involved in cell wall biosynthesis